MDVHYDQNPEESLSIGATVEEFKTLAELFFCGEPFTIETANEPSRFYSETARDLVYIPLDDDQPVFIEPQGDRVVLRGGKKIVERFGRGLINFFTTPYAKPGHHFHLDWFDGTGNIAEGSRGLTFSLRA
jgi:hypothetical protein